MIRYCRRLKIFETFSCFVWRALACVASVPVVFPRNGAFWLSLKVGGAKICSAVVSQLRHYGFCSEEQKIIPS